MVLLFRLLALIALFCAGNAFAGVPYIINLGGSGTNIDIKGSGLGIPLVIKDNSAINTALRINNSSGVQVGIFGALSATWGPPLTLTNALLFNYSDYDGQSTIVVGDQNTITITNFGQAEADIIIGNLNTYNGGSSFGSSANNTLIGNQNSMAKDNSGNTIVGPGNTIQDNVDSDVVIGLGNTVSRNCSASVFIGFNQFGPTNSTSLVIIGDNASVQKTNDAAAAPINCIVIGAGAKVYGTKQMMIDPRGTSGWTSVNSTNAFMFGDGVTSNLWINAITAVKYPVNAPAYEVQPIAWSGATNAALNLERQSQYFSTLTPVALTGVANKNGSWIQYVETEFANTSGTNITLTIGGNIRSLDYTTSYTITNGAVASLKYNPILGSTNVVVRVW